MEGSILARSLPASYSKLGCQWASVCYRNDDATPATTMATLRILSRWRRGAATLSCSTPRHLSTTSALLNRPFENPLHRMKSAEQLELEGFEMPYAWPYKEKQYRWYHSTLDRDPTVWKFYENSKLILIEGNVGVGKTRLGEQLAKYFNMKFMSDDTLLDMQDEYDVFWPQKDYNSILPFIMQRFYRHQFMENPFDIRAARMQCDMLRSRFYQYFLAMLHILSTGECFIVRSGSGRSLSGSGSYYSICLTYDFCRLFRSGSRSRAKHLLRFCLHRGYAPDELYFQARLDFRNCLPSGRTKILHVLLLWLTARYYYYELHQNSVPDQRLLKPHLVIYLDAPVDVCLDRIKGRNRVCMQCITVQCYYSHTIIILSG